VGATNRQEIPPTIAKRANHRREGVLGIHRRSTVPHVGSKRALRPA